MHLSNYGVPHLAYLREDVGGKREICRCHRNLPRGVGTRSGLPIHSNCILVVFKHLWEILFTDTHISLSHIVRSREFVRDIHVCMGMLALSPGHSQILSHSSYILFSSVTFKHLWEILDEFHRYPYLPVTHCAQQADMGYL